MSDRYNVGARIIPMADANVILAGACPGAELPQDEYDRVQLLTEDAAKDLVHQACAGNLDFTNLKYGELAKDFPLCVDYAKVALALIVLHSAVAGLSVRPYVFRLHYTKASGSRHAINGFLLADGRVIYLEPQGMKWLDKPADLEAYDRVRL